MKTSYLKRKVSGVKLWMAEFKSWLFLFVGCVALGKRFDLSEVQFPHLENEPHNSIYLTGWVEI